MAASSHRERLRLDALVRQSEAAELVSSSDSPEDWAALAQARSPDVLVADSPEAAASGIPVLVLSIDPVPLEGPVRGTLPPETNATELAAALRAIDAGLLVSHPTHQRRRWTEIAAPTPLSPRESEVLAMLAEGLGNKMIAARLGITENTVKFHVSSIMEKLEAGSRTEAVARGLRQGLLVI